MTDALGNRTQFAYDENGNRSAITDAHNNVTTYMYDNFNQITAITDALNQTTSFMYDLFGNVTSVTDAQGNTTQKVYDNQNRLQSQTDALNQATLYAYDANGNLTGIIDANGNTTTYIYDSLDHLTMTTWPDGSNEQYIYDKAGNRITRTDRKGQTVTYTYNELNRITAKTYPDNSQVNYTYDNLGRLTAAVNSACSLSYTYDDLNRVTQAVQDGKTVSYTYDAMGNRTRLTYPDNSFVTYTYNALNRLVQIKNATEETIADFTYDELSRRTRLDLRNGTRTEYQYDTLHRLTSLSSKKTSTETIITNFNYTFDRMGNRLSMTTPSGVNSYQYDAVYQLTGVDYPSPFTDMNYNYDNVANRTSTVNGGMVNYTANTLNQYTTAGDTVFTYDANGNMTGSVAPAPTPAVPPYLGGTYSFQYDYENRLVQADTPSNIASYAYGPFGRRTAKTVSSETVKYIYDGAQIIAEYDGSDTSLRKFIYGVGIDEPVVMDTGGTQYYYHFDALGSVTALTDSDGALVETYRYDVYGKPCIMDASDPFAIECCFSACSTTVGNPYLFTGRRFDSESGLYYYRARHYSPELGRFLRVDPIGYFDSLNLYQYVQSNPINFVDPFGLEFECPIFELGVIHNHEELERYPRRSGELKFHCGFSCYLEKGKTGDCSDDPQGECCYDDYGMLVDEAHPYSGCRGTENEYPCPENLSWWTWVKQCGVRHGLMDNGGLWQAGWDGAQETQQKNIDEKPPYLGSPFHEALSDSLRARVPHL